MKTEKEIKQILKDIFKLKYQIDNNYYMSPNDFKNLDIYIIEIREYLKEIEELSNK